MTIRELCRREAPKIDVWYQRSLEVQREFILAPGNVEVTMDGTIVNTTKGPKEVKVGIISKRKRGRGVLPEQWAIGPGKNCWIWKRVWRLRQWKICAL